LPVPLTLVIETASTACSVALLDGTELLDERHELVSRGHAERLVPMIEALLGDRRPDAIAVDCGPGSFTGVRVGLAAARALALAWEVEVSGFSSLALIAAAGIGGAGPIAVALPGGHGELFVQRFGGDPLAALVPLRSLLPTDAAAKIPDDLVIGAGAAALVAARGMGKAREAHPRAADFTLLPFALTQLAPSPLYGRAPDAKPAS
jgi:tRNA threonylcarbamoyl adenosine modification protein YeaZ